MGIPAKEGVDERRDWSPPREPVRYFQRTVPIRGCRLGLEDVKAAYRDLGDINRKFGQEQVSGITPFPDETPDQYLKRMDFLLRAAFCLTVTVCGGRDEEVHDKNGSIFSSDDLPRPIRSIYFTNPTAWRRHAGNANPPNRIEVHLDFGKPDLIDPHLGPSGPAPNLSSVSFHAQDMTYFRAAQQVVKERILDRQTWYSPIRRSFAYDVGVWALTMPAGLILATYYMEQWLPVGSGLYGYRWAFFLYALGLALVCHRFLSIYMKWAFPVNVLADNRDAALKHRLAFGAVCSGLV